MLELALGALVWAASLAAIVLWFRANSRRNSVPVAPPGPPTTSLQPDDYDRLVRAERNAKAAMTAVEELEADMKRRFGKLYAAQRRAEPDEPEERPETMDPAQLRIPLTPAETGRRLVPKPFSANSRGRNG